MYLLFIYLQYTETTYLGKKLRPFELTQNINTERGFAVRLDFKTKSQTIEIFFFLCNVSKNTGGVLFYIYLHLVCAAHHKCHGEQTVCCQTLHFGLVMKVTSLIDSTI